MNKKKAMKILEKCAKDYIHRRLSFDANLFEKNICKDIRCERAFKERKEILEALSYFEQPKLFE